MKIQLIFKKSLILIFGAIFLFSCNDNNDVEFQVIPEVFAIKKEINDTVRYALAFYAYSNSAIQSAEVNFPGNVGSPVSLSSFKNTLITFAWEPGENDYSKTEPLNGQYLFTVQNTGGDIIEDYDLLATNNMDIPVINSATFNANNNSIRIDWGEALGAENYFIRLLNLNRETVYLGYEVDADSTNYTMYPSDEGWETTPNSGTTYIVQLNAVSYEDNINVTEYYYHVNAISVAEAQIIWNP